ncbi:hypothetical protein [Dietzia maris]|uniref:hypothetical protein n=1 Tax=Dietzia maris TaxID=37915 RepID=UPI0037C8F6DF
MDIDSYRDPLGRINIPLVRALDRTGKRLLIVGIALLLLAGLFGAVAGDALSWHSKLLAIAPGFLAAVAGVVCRIVAQSRLTDLQ